MKYGLKAILRTPVKTALFMLLIAVVSGFLAMGAGMYRSSERMLREADAVFKTAGEFVFTGGHYPEAGATDEALAEAKAAFNFDDYITGDVLMFEQSAVLRGHIEGGRPPVQDMPYRRYGVFTLTVIAGHEGILDCRVSKIHYSEDEGLLEGLTVSVAEADVPELRVGRQYVAFGELVGSFGTRGLSFAPRSFTNDLYIPESYGICEWCYDVTGCDINEFWESGAGAYFNNAIEIMRTVNHSFNITAAYDIAAVSSFHLGDTILETGTIPTDRSVPSCLFPIRLAAQLGIEAGDKVTFNIHKPSVGKGVYASYLQQEGFAARETFTVTGIYRTEQFSAPVYVLDCGQPWIAASDADYTLARVVIKNRAAASYTEYVKGLLPGGVSFEPFDQGYETATRSIYNMRETAILITAVSGLVGGVVLWFFAYLFVYRAAESVRIILRLGAGTVKALAFLLSGSGLTSLTAGLVGVLAGYFFSGGVVNAVYASAGAESVYDLRFSILSRGAQLETFKPTPRLSLDIYVAVFAVIVIAAVLLCLVFGVITVRTQNAHVRFKKAKRRSAARAGSGVKKFSGVYDLIPGVPLRYAIRSIFRGRLRSLTVPALFTVMLIFVFIFNQVREGYGAELETVYNDVPVNLWFTNSRALVRDLNIRGQSFTELESSGYVRDKWRTNDYSYMDLGLALRADGTEAETPPEDFIIPDGAFSYETFSFQIMPMTSPLKTAEQLMNSPPFRLAGESAVNWAEGYTLEDYEAFDVNWSGAMEAVPGLFSKNYLSEKGYKLGDEIRVSFFFLSPMSNSWENLNINVTAAGAYEAEVDQSTIYMPSGMDILKVFLTEINKSNYNQIYVFGDMAGGHTGVLGEDGEEEDYGIYTSGGFTVKDPAKLGELKDWLETRYDPVGKVSRQRRWLIIDDKALYNTIESLNRYIGYMDMLFPVMMAAVAAIGFIASSLLLKSRGGEIAALRSLGARAGQVFASFFIEPVILSLPGIALGLAFAMLLLNVTARTALGYVPLLALCYYIGAAAAAAHTYRKAVMISLRDAE
jgi:ABC-type lipoprotein release transport system permease subunit